MSLKNRVKELIPPVFLKVYRKMNSAFKISGNYLTWEEAVNNSIGYEDESIVNKVKDSLLKVKNNQAVAERDSILLNEIPYSWPVLSILLKESQKGSLSVIDFGGSLGSSYFYYKDWFNSIELDWNIIEQKSFVRVGKEFFEDNELKFFESLKEVSKTDVVLLSSVLPYLFDPWSVLSKIMDLNPQFICVDRTVFSIEPEERISVQKVSSSIYNASYPIRLIPELKLENYLIENYKKIIEYSEKELASIYNIKGLIFKRKD